MANGRRAGAPDLRQWTGQGDELADAVVAQLLARAGGDDAAKAGLFQDRVSIASMGVWPSRAEWAAGSSRVIWRMIACISRILRIQRGPWPPATSASGRITAVTKFAVSAMRCLTWAARRPDRMSVAATSRSP